MLNWVQSPYTALWNTLLNSIQSFHFVLGKYDCSLELKPLCCSPQTRLQGPFLEHFFDRLGLLGSFSQSVVGPRCYILFQATIKLKYLPVVSNTCLPWGVYLQGAILDSRISDGFQETRMLCHFQLFASPWTVARQAPLSMGFSRQEYWSGLPFPLPSGNISDVKWW